MESILLLYNAFESYPRFSEPRECTHCISEAEQREMMSIPLRTFPAHLLFSLLYNFICETWGGLSDIKHFIPRMLEILLYEKRGIDLVDF